MLPLPLPGGPLPLSATRAESANLDDMSSRYAGGGNLLPPALPDGGAPTDAAPAAAALFAEGWHRWAVPLYGGGGGRCAPDASPAIPFIADAEWSNGGGGGSVASDDGKDCGAPAGEEPIVVTTAGLG